KKNCITDEDFRGRQMEKAFNINEGSAAGQAAAFAERLIRAYSRHYNVFRASETGEDMAKPVPGELAARCDLHMSESKYIMTEKHVIWQTDCHEYCYIFQTEHLTKELYEKFLEYAERDGMSRIHPDRNHKCSAITVMVAADTADREAVKALRKCRIHKSFAFSFHGWMDVRTALAVLSAGEVASNFGGHENAAYLKKLIARADKTVTAGESRK
ncbi:MAG: hypothetical protein Q4B09_05135, partial [Lachnospiraceae bacterium]|nr:hypothetical protein [Lachnospiraceae bacterium]